MNRPDLQALDRQLAEARREIRDLEARLAEEADAHAGRSAEVRDLLQSTSWRLTAPLRWLVGRLRGQGQAASVPLPPPAAEATTTRSVFPW